MAQTARSQASAGSGGWLTPLGLLLLGMLPVIAGAFRLEQLSEISDWISRAYAIGLGAATQMLVLMVAGIIAGPPNELTHDSLMALSWLINLAVAEFAMRKRRAPRRRTTRPSTAHVTASFSGEHP
jgi:hypothetical protein